MKDKYKILDGRRIAYENGKGWTVSFKNYCLTEIDFVSKTCKGLVNVGKNEYGTPQYLMAAKCKDLIYLAPFSVENIGVYNTKTDELSRIELEPVGDTHMDLPHLCLFYQGVVIDDYYVLSGYKYPAVVLHNVNTKELVYINDWQEQVDSRLEEGRCLGYFSSGVCKDGDFLYVPFACIPAMLKINLADYTSKIIDLNIESEGVNSLSYYKDNQFIISGRGNKSNIIGIFDCVSETVINSIVVEEISKESIAPIWDIMCFNNKIISFPLDAISDPQMPISEIDFEHHRVHPLNDLSECSIKYNADGISPVAVTMLLKADEERCIFATGNDMVWYDYNVVSGVKEKFQMHYDEEDEVLRRAWSNLIQDEICGRIIFERDLSLDKFIEKIDLI